MSRTAGRRHAQARDTASVTHSERRPSDMDSKFRTTKEHELSLCAKLYRAHQALSADAGRSRRHYVEVLQAGTGALALIVALQG